MSIASSNRDIRSAVDASRYSINPACLARSLNQSLSDQRGLHSLSKRNFDKTAETITYSVQRAEAIATLNRQLDLGMEHASHLDEAKDSARDRSSAKAVNRDNAHQPNARDVKSGISSERSFSGRPASSSPPSRSWSELTDRAFLAECKDHDQAAEILYLESLSLCTRQPSQPGEQQANRIYVLRQLAKLYLRQKRYVEAEPLLNQALQLRAQMALEDELVGEFCYQLATIYQSQQRYAEADELFQRAFRLFSQYLGANHPQTQAAYRDLMQLLMSSIEIGKFEELNAGSTPLDLDNLSEVYSWAKPAWQQ